MPNCVSCGGSLAENSRFCPACGTPASADATPTRTVAAAAAVAARTSGDGRFVPGATLAGRYRIVALLGRGGMGEVYRADDLSLNQQVALKFLPASVVKNPNALERFRNEVRVARRVSHRNVCRVYDLGEADGHVFLSMEYVDGEDLGSLLRRIGRLPEAKALEIARRLCAGLAAAHEKGVLHRDLKPANIMLDAQGQVLLTDFGLAGLADQMEGAEVRNGTPAYMAPEQLAGKEVTVKSDLYSLGLVLYEILTGKRPFESDTQAGLERARRETTITNPSTLVKDLDPRVERVILRCLEAEPARRPASALAVAAGLPGGDPLGEALAAGETPSPEMVAAAGEGTALSPRVAVALFAAVAIGLAAQAVLSRQLSALERMQLDYSPEILAQKARDFAQRFGFTQRPADDAYTLTSKSGFLEYVESQGRPRWDEILKGRPALLELAYRQSDYPLTPGEFHDDKLTPGIVTFGGADPDPAPIMSGMIEIRVDSQGRLTSFSAIPPQVETAAAPARPFDWNVLFDAAQVDPSKLQPAEPQWTFLGATDQRVAWTGKWPGSEWPMRVEAAAFHGKPVGFALIGPWDAPSRMPPRDPPRRSRITLIILACVGIFLLVRGVWMARRNLMLGKGDVRGALRLAHFIFWAQIAVWVLRAHFNLSLGNVGMLFVAVATSFFRAAAIWAIYVALEPYARRHWPKALISWTGVLSGRYRDPIVARDVLFGLALGMIWTVLDRMADVIGQSRGLAPNFGNLSYLMGTRSTLAVCANEFPAAILTGLGFFFIFFVLRAALRNQWLAGAAFVLIWTAEVYFNSRPTVAAVQGAEALAIYSIAAIMVVRFGLLALVIGVGVIDLLSGLQVPGNPSAWYFPDTLAVLVALLAIAIWAFRASIGGQRLFREELFS